MQNKKIFLLAIFSFLTASIIFTRINRSNGFNSKGLDMIMSVYNEAVNVKNKVEAKVTDIEPFSVDELKKIEKIRQRLGLAKKYNVEANNLKYIYFVLLKMSEKELQDFIASYKLLSVNFLKF